MFRLTSAVTAAVPFLLFLLHTPRISAAGYHYNRPPTAAGPTGYQQTGHYFAPLPTVQPLPPVPALPALPTARTHAPVQQQQQQHVQTLVQLHPTTAPARSIAAAYRPPSIAAAPRARYLPPSGPAHISSAAAYQTGNIGARPQQQQHRQLQLQPPPQSQLVQRYTPTGTAPTGLAFTAPGAASAAAQTTRSQVLPVFGQRYPTAPSGPAASAAATPAQPLRIPFGKQAVISYPTGAGGGAPNGDFYVANGRQLKQYAVIEIIDNDLEQMTQPFLTSTFFNDRAQFGVSAAGSSNAGVQLEARSSTLRQAQQRLTQQQQQRQQPGEAIALGSGGLGYIRLQNGNVYLGSGSLGYISNQERSQSLREARTRSGSPVPDALHFGHGPLNDNVFRY